MTSPIIDKIREDLTAAMKARDDKLRVSTLRLMSAAIKDRDIAARAEDRCCGLSDDEVIAILSKMVKQREDSAQTYEDAGRINLAEQERQEMEIIRAYLPRQMSPDEVKGAVDAVVSELDADGLKDMGRCMGTLKKKYHGAMDFGKANAILKDILAG